MAGYLIDSLGIAAEVGETCVGALSAGPVSTVKGMIATNKVDNTPCGHDWTAEKPRGPLADSEATNESESSNYQKKMRDDTS